MHHIIRFVVVADTKEGALEIANEWLDNISGENSRYGIDYGQFFDGPGSAVSGAGRWGEREAAPKLTSKEGMRMFLAGCIADYESYKEAYDTAKEILKEKSAHELYDESMEKYRIKRIYDQEFIFHDYQFMTMIDIAKFAFSEIKLDECRVVPCDVHT